jgi:hypothetical protein
MPIQRLILEGQNDKHTISNLLYVLDVPDPIDYETKEAFWNDFLKVERFEGGKQEALKMFKKSLKEPSLDCLGLIVDADESALNTWRSIRNLLINARFSTENLPDTPSTNGTIIQEEGKPLVGIWIMPDNLNPEPNNPNAHFYLEHFYESLIAKEDILLEKATSISQSIFDSISHDVYDSRFKNVHFQKAKIHTWLAWIDEPGDSLGRTLKKKQLFNFENELLTRFINWYKTTFKLQEHA